MKAVIVDLNGKDAVALRDDGRFEKVKNKNYSIGQELTLQPQMIRFPKQAAIAASAAIAIATCGGMGTYTWSNPISYVSLDINPSIAYSLNEFNRVIAVDGMNDEGTAIVETIGDSLKNTDITTALTITVEQLSTDAYLDSENTNYMVIGVYSDKDSKASALMSTVDEFTANSADTCSITTVNVSKETKESADSYGITGGKMELINEIANVAANPQEVDPAALADLTVAELEQTKNVAASGASVTEAVAAVTPAAKDSESEDTPAVAVDPDTVASDSKPADDVANTSSTKKDEASAEKPADESNTAVTSSGSVTPAGDPAATDNKTGGSTANTGSSANAGSNSSTGSSGSDKNGNGSSGKKNDADTSPAKGDASSSEKKEESGSSEKKDSSSSGKKEEVTEDSSQQTNSNLEPEIPDEPAVEIPMADDSILACSIAV